MKDTKLIHLFMLPFLLAAGCGNSDRQFSENERALITDDPGTGVMRLYTVDVPEENELLRREALPLTKEMIGSDLFNTLCERMRATVKDPGNEGVGIAAPQVGISRKLIAVQRFDKEGYPFEFYANPEITFYSEEKQKGREGCLSVPEKSGIVERSGEITVEYTDPVTSERKKEAVNGFTAVIFQHEADHLAGIVYTDKCEPGTEPGQIDE